MTKSPRARKSRYPTILPICCGCGGCGAKEQPAGGRLLQARAAASGTALPAWTISFCFCDDRQARDLRERMTKTDQNDKEGTMNHKRSVSATDWPDNPLAASGRMRDCPTYAHSHADATYCYICSCADRYAHDGYQRIGHRMGLRSVWGLEDGDGSVARNVRRLHGG